MSADKLSEIDCVSRVYPKGTSFGAHKDVFFYLCMEEHEMWNKTFGYQYSTNNDFERAMLSSYSKKLNMEYLI